MNEQNIRVMVRGVYDLQKLRIQSGNRIVSNFKVKLGIKPSSKEDDSDLEVQKILKTIKLSYDRITDGVTQISKRTKFEYDGVISDFAELSLVDHYMGILRNEEQSMKRLSMMVEHHPLWKSFLKDVKGIGGAIAGVIISEIDISKAKYVSSLWKYSGLDVINGEGRSRRKDHLEDVEYTDKNGEVKTKKSITFNPFLKTKLVGVLGSSFLRSKGEYRTIYDDYKNRIVNHPDHQEKSKGHIHNMSIRYMVKMFLQDLYVIWREIEGLEVHPSYQEAKLGHSHKSD